MATLLDLPAEILEKFLVPLNDIDLVYRAANVSRTLNSLALKEYFRRFAVVGVDCVVVGNIDTRLALRALRSALWIKRVPTLTIRLSPGHSIFREINDLARFVRQLDSLGTLNLYIFGHVYRPPYISSVERTKLGNIWWKCFGALLEAVLSKGVEGLCVFEAAPDMLQKYIRMDHQPPIQEYQKLRQWVMKRRTRLLSYIRQAGEDHSSLPDPLKDPVLHLLERETEIVCGEPSVKDVHISRMLLLPLFFHDTLNILRAHTHTICAINLHEIFMDQKCWKALLGNLQIPRLERFTFTGPSVFVEQNSLVPIDVLLSFLSRHSKITHLQLISILREHILESLSQYKPIPSMPNLRALTAHAALAGALLQYPHNCKNLDFLCLSCRSPHPTSLTRSVGICIPEFDLTLAAIALNALQPVMVELELETATDVLSWMKGEGDPRSVETVQKLAHVHDITIFLCGNVSIDTNLLANVLPKWLGSFPALHRLHIHIDPKEKQTFSTAIINLCPHLRTFMINYGVILPVRSPTS